MPFSQAIADANLNWLRNQEFPTASPNFYVSIHSSNPGPAGIQGDVTVATVSTRGVIAAANLSVPAPSLQSGGGREISNTIPVLLSSSALAAASVTHFGIWNSSAGGLFIAYGLLTPPAQIVIGDVVKFDPGQLRVRALT